VLFFSWLSAENFEAFHQQLRIQKLKVFLVLISKFFEHFGVDVVEEPEESTPAEWSLCSQHAWVSPRWTTHGS